MPNLIHSHVNNRAKASLTLQDGRKAEARVHLDMPGLLSSFEKSIVINRYSPVVQRSIGINNQKNIMISGSMMTSYSPVEGDYSGYSFIQVRKNNTGKASVYSGYGVAWRPSVPIGREESVISVSPGSNGQSYYDIEVALTGVDIEPGVAFLKSIDPKGKSIYTPFTYAGYSGGILSNCYISSPVPSPESGHEIVKSSPNVYIVDNDTINGDGYSGQYLIDPLTGLSYIQAAIALIAPDTRYYFKMVIGEDNAITFALDTSPVVDIIPENTVITSGSTTTLSEFTGSEDSDSFGLSVYDTAGKQWWYDDIRIEKLSGEYAVGYFRFNVYDMPEDLQLEVAGYAESGGGQALRAIIWDPALKRYDTILSSAVWPGAVLVSDIFKRTTYQSDGHVMIQVTSLYPSEYGAPSHISIDYIKIIRANILGVHMGGCVDVYLDDPGAALIVESRVVSGSGTVTLDGAMDISSIATSSGVELTYSRDYIIAEASDDTANSVKGNTVIMFSEDYWSTPVNISRWASAVVSDASSLLEQPEHRPLNTNILVKHKRVHEINVTPYDASMAMLLFDYLSQVRYENGVKTVSISGFNAYVYGKTGVSKQYSLVINSFDGRKRRMTTIQNVSQAYSISETETFRVIMNES